MAEEKLANGKTVHISSRVEELIKVGLMILGPLLIGAMAWQSLSDEVEDLAETDTLLHRRTSGVEDEQKQINSKLQDIVLEQRDITNDIGNIQQDIEEIKNAVIQ